jgi:hypothetical protein
MNSITLLIHVDALRHDYVISEYMPFLNSLSEKGIYKTLIPPFGFEPDGAYLTGLEPEEYNGGTHFVLRKSDYTIPFSSYLPKILDRLDIYTQYPIRKLYQKLISKYSEYERIKYQPFIGYIPFQLLKYFDFCDHFLTNSPYYPNEKESLFDILRKKNIKYFYHAPPMYKCSCSNLLARVKSELDSSYKFAYLFIADLDIVGHKYGPDSLERKLTSKIVDDTLHEIFLHLEKKFSSINIIAFGDHGMVNVINTIDFRPIIGSLGLRLGVDYVYFLDSTFARFWVFNDNARFEIINKLRLLPLGKVISETERNFYHINFKDNRFGDIIFWVDGGTMIFPNFWHIRNKKKGMHGYRREVVENHAALITNFKLNNNLESKEFIEMKEIFNITLDALADE